MSNNLKAKWESSNRLISFCREQCTERPLSFSIFFSSSAKEFATQLQENANCSPKETMLQTPWNCFLEITKLPLISTSPISFRLQGLSCLNFYRKEAEHTGCVNSVETQGFSVLSPCYWSAWVIWGFCLFPGAEGVKRSWWPNVTVTAPCPVTNAQEMHFLC